MKQFVANLFQLTTCMAIASIIAGRMGGWHFALDLASHFRCQAVLALLVSGIALLILRRFRWAAFAVLSGVTLLGTLWPYLNPLAQRGGSGDYRLVSINVLTSNQRHGQVIDFLRQVDPDFVVLQEIDQHWIDVLDPALASRWPHRKSVPRSDNFGMALYSKLPWTNCEVVEFSQFDLPSLSVDWELPDSSSLRLIAIHPLPPMTGSFWRDRNRVFRGVADRIRESAGERTIVIGDLNCSPWSVWFERFRRETGLRDSAEGFGIHPTWLPISLSVCGLPIDHALVGRDIRVRNRFVGPNVGSDHRPIVIEFNTPNRNSARTTQPE